MKNELMNALNEIMYNYDAYFIENKYRNFEDMHCTHHKEFMMLKDFIKDDEIGNTALNWIRYCYDSYYVEQVLSFENNAFVYLKSLIEKSDK